VPRELIIIPLDGEAATKAASKTVAQAIRRVPGVRVK
jgi:hypothetical protein